MAGLVDDPFDDVMKYDGTCPVCHGDDRRCDGTGECAALNEVMPFLLQDAAVKDVIRNANTHGHKKPNIRTLSEEFAEAILAERGKHEHPLRLELVQIAGVCINMIRQLDAGEEFKK